MALEALCTATLHAQGAQVSELKRQVISLKRELEAARQELRVIRGDVNEEASDSETEPE